MKVLFAVNDENISTSIVKKYQKQYKEIISYKNVYYFNAILKEIQKNKSYDRIVISEDLEEFTSTSYEQKDKFIFDRLDSISDEASSNTGNDIPIILICSERRTKSEEILVKLFGIGIYNAIIGDDRSQEEVCRLINKPRSKKEAKIYYRIDTEDVNYTKENESDVNEVEMQNILKHFKRLGKNEDEYAKSFANIVSQYNEAQLKVIITILPENIKEVLAETSPEYQKLVYTNKSSGKGIKKGQTKKGKADTKKEKTKEKVKGTSEKLLEVQNTPIISKPVVVPTTMEKNVYKKVVPKKAIDVDLDEIEDEEITDDVQKILEQKPKKRGRPRKKPLPEPEEENTQEIEKTKKKRGRPRKKPLVEDDEETEEIQEVNILPGFSEQDEEEDIEEENYLNSTVLPGIGEDDDEEVEYVAESTDNDDYEEDADYNKDEYSYKGSSYTEQIEDLEEYDNVFDDREFESLLTGDKKVVTFVGTGKNGTSFIVNNIARILSEMGIDTAILDATSNKNSYYIYTKNDEDLRRTAIASMQNLIEGVAEGIEVNSKLTVYTTIPSQKKEIKNSHPIMETLIRNHSIVLIDCDFTTPIEYFERSQEMYLVQSMDVLTIQPLTEFLRELKTKNVLDERKIRIIINKVLKVKGATSKNIVGGMANYNDPEMSFMTELFDKNTAKIAALIPFDEDVYSKYLESLIECEIKINGYPKEFRARLNNLAEVIYPLLPKAGGKKNKKANKNGYTPNSSFSSGMNSTLDDMRKKY